MSLSGSENTIYDERATSRDSQINLLRPREPCSFWRRWAACCCCKTPLKIVQQWLKGQQAYTLHKLARRTRYKTRQYRTSGIDHQWQADLVDMQVEAPKNEGFKYILTVIDLFSRYAWAEPLKTKSPIHVKPAFEAIFSKGRKPFKIQTDQGTELDSKTMKDFFTSHKIHQFAVKSAYHAAVVED